MTKKSARFCVIALALCASNAALANSITPVVLANCSAVGSCSLNLSTVGVSDGDVVIIHMAHHNNAAASGGFTVTADESYTALYSEVAHSGDANFSSQSYYRVWATGNDTSISVVTGNSNQIHASAFKISGTTGTPRNPTANEVSSSTTITAPSITTAVDDEIIWLAAASDNVSAAVSGGGATQLYSLNSTDGSDTSLSAGYDDASGTSSGTQAFSISASRRSIMATVAWAPAAETDAPAYTSAPAAGTPTSSQVVISATATDDTGPIDHYCSSYATGNTPSYANLKAGEGTGVVSGPFSHLNVSSGAAATMTVTGLSPSTTYDIWCGAEDNVATANTTAATEVNNVTTAAACRSAADKSVTSVVRETVRRIDCRAL